MSIQQLRKQASLRGISSNGSKKELVERFCAAVVDGHEADGAGSYMVYNRWGRVGAKGQDKLFGPYSCRESAIQEFEQKFLAKTKNHWSNRKDFVSHPKCYTWLEMDYNEKEQESSQGKPSVSCTNIQPQETKLEPRVAKFISLICNIGMMRQQMMEIGYNAEKLPLGKLSKSTIMVSSRGLLMLWGSQTENYLNN